MRTTTIAGLVLIVLGFLALAYQGITYTTRKDVVDIGSFHASVNHQHEIPLPPILGGLLLVGGVALLISGSRTAVTR